MDNLLALSTGPSCEGMLNGSMAEPWNQVSALFVTALATHATFVWRREGRGDGLGLILCLSAMAVGIGGAIYHGHPSDDLLPLEVVPAPVFMLFCFVALLQRAFNVDRIGIVLNIIGIVLASAFLMMLVPSRFLGGGALYLAPLIGLYVSAIYLILNARIGMHQDRSLTGVAAQKSDAEHFPRLKAGYGLLQAGILLALALVARAIDLPFCARFGLYLHVLWHILAALAAYRIMMICLLYPVSDRRPAGLVPRAG
ncbi:MAG: hypothetical protein LCH61_12655 [Proteobacteria bacterium]|nr:hypothetical protein [Pseudomonadota bacterium]